MTVTSRRGINTFSNYQDEKQSRREKLIREYLTVLKKSRASFKYLTDLAAHVADYIGREENGKCDRATLLRNMRYKTLLSKHMACISDQYSLQGSAVIDINTAKALLIESELTITNLRRKLSILSSYCENLEAQLSSSVEDDQCSELSTEIVSDKHIETEFKYRFVKTCQALRLLLDYLPGQFLIDTTNCALKDATMRRGDNIVVHSDNIKPFLEWISSESR